MKFHYESLGTKMKRAIDRAQALHRADKGPDLKAIELTIEEWNSFRQNPGELLGLNFATVWGAGSKPTYETQFRGVRIYSTPKTSPKDATAQRRQAEGEIQTAITSWRYK